MDRRLFVVGGHAAGSANALAAPAPALAPAQTLPDRHWPGASSSPRSADISFGAGEPVGWHVAALADGKFQRRVFPAGARVPALQAANVVGGRSVDAAHTASHCFAGKVPENGFGSFIYANRAQEQRY